MSGEGWSIGRVAASIIAASMAIACGDVTRPTPIEHPLQPHELIEVVCEPYCYTRPPTETEDYWIQYNSQHNIMRDKHPECMSIYNDLSARHSCGLIRFYECDDGNSADFHPGGTSAGQIHRNSTRIGSDLGWLLLHEGAHSALGVPEEGPNGALFWMAECTRE